VQACLRLGLFSRRREDQEGMEDWDQDKLEEVVNQKHGTEKPTNKTDIICKFFLDAVESKLYGWWGLHHPPPLHWRGNGRSLQVATGRWWSSSSFTSHAAHVSLMESMVDWC